MVMYLAQKDPVDLVAVGVIDRPKAAAVTGPDLFDSAFKFQIRHGSRSFLLALLSCCTCVPGAFYGKCCTKK